MNVTPHEVQNLLSATVSTLRDLAVLVDLQRSRTSDLLENNNTVSSFQDTETADKTRKAACSVIKEEVTEKVWNILLKCSDIKQVTMLLKTFLQAMMYGRIKSQVHDNNRSHLAQLIKSSKHGAFRMPRLERLNTIEILMEIGVESLRRRIVDKFVTSLVFPEEELEMMLGQCEKELKATHGESESRAFGLLPFAMALATVVQVNSLLKDDDKTLILDITRKVLTKYTKNLRSSDNKSNGQLNSVYAFETTLPFSRLNQASFLQKRPRVWTSETNVTIGGVTAAKIMACLQLEVPLEHVTNMVNSVRPIKKIDEEEKTSLDDRNADYTVSHTLITYHPKF